METCTVWQGAAAGHWLSEPLWETISMQLRACFFQQEQEQVVMHACWLGPGINKLCMSPQVVLSPHLYPPTITKATFLGAALWQQCQSAFGHLYTRGYCYQGKCTQFPVVIGETGSFMADWKDRQWLDDFSQFVTAQVSASALCGEGHVLYLPPLL